MAKPRAFISFAAEDARFRDLFVGQGKLDETPWEVADWSLHEPFTSSWKTQTRARIKRTHVLIMLVGAKTYLAEGAIWEVNCAREEEIPVFGVRISKKYPCPRPSCLKDLALIDWTWDGIARIIKKLTS